jgi:hypothetical protein
VGHERGAPWLGIREDLVTEQVTWVHGTWTRFLDAFGWSEKSKGAWHLGDETWEFSGFAELLDREVRLWGWLGDEFGGWEPDGFSLGNSPGDAVVGRRWRRENVSVTFFGGGLEWLQIPFF